MARDCTWLSSSAHSSGHTIEKSGPQFCGRKINDSREKFCGEDMGSSYLKDKMRRYSIEPVCHTWQQENSASVEKRAVQ